MANKGRRKKRTTSLMLHNGIIESRYNLSAMEIKTLFAIAYKIQNNERGQNIVEYIKESDDEMVYYTATEIGQAIGIQKGSFKHFERVCERLIGTVITIRNPDKPDDDWKKMSFLSTAEYKDGIIGLRPNKDMLPFYTNLTQNYTPLELTAVMSFKSSYTIRVYTLIKQYKNLKPIRAFKIEELKELLGVSKAYTAVKDFRVYVLEPAKKELNEHLPGLNFDYELIKFGRAYQAIKLRFDFTGVSSVFEETLDIELHSKAFECFSKLDFGHQCVHALAPADDKVCSYCFREIKARY